VSSKLRSLLARSLRAAAARLEPPAPPTFWQRVEAAATFGDVDPVAFLKANAPIRAATVYQELGGSEECPADLFLVKERTGRASRWPES
jgi:hypothetical protein